ncbi:MAG: hypothetical protein LBG44_01170 [Gemmatimonadota bacterium]|nr:hypothetical protein [Gemmatimonadota bacterium]
MSDLGDGHRGEISREHSDLLRDHGGDAPPPADQGDRWLSGTIGLVFLVAILVFLVWFAATHRQGAM